MKIRLCAMLAAALLSEACSHKPVAPTFGELTVDTLLGSPAAGFKVEYRFATILNTKKSEALQFIEQSNVGYFFELEAYEGTAREAADSALRQIAAQMALPANLPGAKLPSASLPTGEIIVESEGTVLDTLLSYVITRSSYTGGAHGMYGTECHTYSLNSGYELTTADLFSEEQFTRLGTQIRTKLYERYGVKDDEGLSAQGFFPDYIAPTENFLITADSITFFYNPYEIGCYALGAVEVTLPRQMQEAQK